MIGLTRANDLLLSSRVFLAEEAKAWGLVNDVFEGEDLLERTYAYVRGLVANVSPGSLRETRWQIYRDLHRSVRNAVEDSEALIRRMMKEEDYAEGVRAFLEKRAPRWR
jgi:enoyl-CoA hydratase/carnithine racemase